MSEIERELFAGYGVPYNTNVRMERCVCGGWIEVNTDELARDESRAIEAAVEQHNQTTRHRVWRVWWPG